MDARLIGTGALAISLLAATAAMRSRASSPPATCATSGQAFLSARDLPGMVRFQNVRFRASPMSAFSLNSDSSAISAEFRQGRLVGFISNLALGGKNRRPSNSQRPTWGYATGRWPTVPLRGDIVSSSPRTILEVYENVTEYRGTLGARSHLSILRRSGDGNVAQHQLRFHLGDETYAYEAAPVRRRPQEEYGFGIDVRKGTTVLQIGVWGGAGIPQRVARRLAETVLGRLETACGA